VTNSIAILERCEAEAWVDLYAAAPPEEARLAGIALLEIEDGWATAASRVDVLAYNRTIALGHSGEIPDESLERVIEFYRSAGAPRFFVAVPPGRFEGPNARRLEARGFRLHNRWIKLARGVEAPRDTPTDLRVEQIGPEHADGFASVFVTSFEWPRELAPWIRATVGRKGWRHYLAFDGDRPVATAGTYLGGDVAWLDLASTLPDARGRGAQSALIARRIRDAGQAGCRTLVLDTAEPTAERPVPSHRNVTRLGFRTIYARRNYLYAFA